MKDEALKLALEALEAETDANWKCNSYHPKIWEAITIAKQALAAPVQPVCPACESIEWEGQPCQICQPTPAAQRQWVGLTDEDFIDLCEEASNFGTGGLIRHIEAKLKEKNT
jgi:hypothetical protein